MRREAALLLALLAAIGVAASSARAVAPLPEQTAPPGGILVSVNSSHCYVPNARVRVSVTSLSPGTSVLASSKETVAVNAIASTTGTATLTLLAPSGLPRGRSIEAHLITVGGTDATGEPTGETVAFLLAKRSVCKLLSQRRYKPGTAAPS
jgi:hypothetical protein